MYKSCSRCGRIHDTAHQCPRIYTPKESPQRELRGRYVWAKKSREVREDANHLCEVCRSQGRYVYTDLEVHHITALKDNPALWLDDDNLICLCPEHHHMAESGEIDAEYLRQLVQERHQRQG